MEKFEKIDKEFCFTDDSVNVYKYRCLTAGLLIDEVKKNPIGFRMHNRGDSPVVRWEDFRFDGDKVFAKPVINLAHPEGERTLNEVKNGFLNGASCGKIRCLDASDDPALKLPGQTGPTVTKWYPGEISLVDIPGNHSALANLCDKDGNDLNLADFVKPIPQETMSKNVILAATILTALNLSDKSEQADVDKALQDLVDRADKGDKAVKDLSDLTEKHTKLETEHKTLTEEISAKEVKDLIDAGTKAGKVTVELGNHLAAEYKGRSAALKDLMDKMPAQTSVIQETVEELADLKDATYDTLWSAGKLEEVKAKHPAFYEKLHKEKFKN